MEQEHEVILVVHTSGNLRVADVAALNFVRVILEMAEARPELGWENQKSYAQKIINALEEKGEFGIDTELVRKLKGLILRGEVRDAASVCGLSPNGIRFLALPFYERGRYRRFRMEEEDVE